jgi:N-acetylglucosamine-6-phosphate deacetylase
VIPLSSPLLIINARVVTPTGIIERGWLASSNHRIESVGSGAPPALWVDHEVIDANGRTALPGFIDVHVHGGDGVDCMDADAAALDRMASFFARHGVTGFLPTTWTAGADAIHRALQAIASAQGPRPDGATILGAHLEGPYLNLDRAGAQDRAQIRRASRDEALSFLNHGVVRLVALAPEFPENWWLIEECVRRGITVSAAHTAATYEDILQAVALGLSHATHTFNAMGTLHHRTPGTVGAVLSCDSIMCELIADNIHVHPAAQRILFASKGPDRVILITDAVRGAGLPAGTVYTQDGRSVRVRDGASYLSDGTIAGSGLTMDRALFNFSEATGYPIETLWPATSLNAARSIGLSDRTGSLEAGKDADIVLIDAEGAVSLTVALGSIVFRNEI